MAELEIQDGTMYDITCEKAGSLRKFSLRAEQITVKNLAKLTSIKPDTMYLLSEEDGYVALPDQDSGRFHGLACFRTWRVSGSLSTSDSTAAIGTPLTQPLTQQKWKPKYYPTRSNQNLTAQSQPSNSSEQQVRQTQCLHNGIV